MINTKHFDTRCRQRGISKLAVDFTLREGHPLDVNKDRIIMTRKIYTKVDKRKYSANTLKEVEKMLPLCIVVGNVNITAFRINRRININKRKHRRYV